MNEDRPICVSEPLRARRRWAGILLVVIVLAAGASLASIGAAIGPAQPAAAQGCAPRLAVSKTSGLAPGGETVSVSGSCFDVNKGIYVAFCVVPPPGSVPTPCGGGVDQSGAGGLSHWISSNPPPYGDGLAIPYGPGGSFSVTMTPSVALNPTVDCRRVTCAIVARNDHTRTGDRGQDVIIPVAFAAVPAPTPAPVVPAPPPSVAPPPTAAPETTTTVSPETTTTTAADTTSTAPVSPGDDDETAELVAAPTSADGGSSSGSTALVVVAVVLVLLVATGGVVWMAVRRRSDPSVP